jgi:hypothetical protein
MVIEEATDDENVQKFEDDTLAEKLALQLGWKEVSISNTEVN